VIDILLNTPIYHDLLIRNAKVTSSIPVSGTKYIKPSFIAGLFVLRRVFTSSPISSRHSALLCTAQCPMTKSYIFSIATPHFDVVDFRHPLHPLRRESDRTSMELLSICAVNANKT
jgi:hypothetical protein